MSLPPGNFMVEEGGVSAPPPYQRHPREIARQETTEPKFAPASKATDSQQA